MGLEAKTSFLRSKTAVGIQQMSKVQSKSLSAFTSLSKSFN